MLRINIGGSEPPDPAAAKISGLLQVTTSLTIGFWLACKEHLPQVVMIAVTVAAVLLVAWLCVRVTSKEPRSGKGFTASNHSPAESRLRELDRLRALGLISESQHEVKKKTILSEL